MISYKVRMMLKKPLLLYLADLLQQRTEYLYGHHHGAVIVILLNIKDCNALIAIELSSFIINVSFVVLLASIFRSPSGDGPLGCGLRY